MIKGRPVDDVIFEVWDGHVDGHPFEECFPLATQVQFIDVPDGTLPGAMWDGTTWVNPAQPPPPVFREDGTLVSSGWDNPGIPGREPKAT